MLLGNDDAAMDAGVPSDFATTPTEPDRRSRYQDAEFYPATAMAMMLALTLRPGKAKPDKLECAKRLHLAGFTATAIIEDLDEAMRLAGLAPAEPEIVR